MKTKIIGLITVFIMACMAITAIIFLPSGVQPGLQPYGPLVVKQKSSLKSLTIGNIYTKEQVITLFGTPDAYSERDADGGIGKDFKCIYGGNDFFFYIDRGFATFILESNDFFIQGIPVSIGEEYDYFRATCSLRMESIPGYEEGVRTLMVWPEGFEDSWLYLYFRENGGKYYLFRIAYSSPV